MNTIPTGRTVATGNEAAAYAALLSRVQVIPAYPITPQTIVVEKLAELVAGREDIIFENMESEHAIFGYASRASRLGVRVFTATSSQGLLYADEQIHRAGRERTPVVAAIVNRSVVAPWSLEPDLNDSMSKRDCGWIQFYCSNNQEILDSVIMGFKVAERILLPAMICYEGFILSHTTTRLDVPSQETVDSFLPSFRPPKDWLIDPDRPRTYSQISDPLSYARFQFAVEKAMQRARTCVEEESRNFSEIFGREKIGLLETSGNPTADYAVVTIGTIGDTAKCLLAENKNLLLVRIHTFRPFPGKELQRVLKGAKKIAVIDRAISFGGIPPLAADAINAVGKDRVASFILGIGGCNVTEASIEKVLRRLKNGKRKTKSDWIVEEN